MLVNDKQAIDFIQFSLQGLSCLGHPTLSAIVATKASLAAYLTQLVQGK